MPDLPPLLRRITDLSGAMRRAGVPVSVSEDLDAVAAVRELDLLDREAFRSALASLLVKSQTHRRTFDELFDVFFPARPEGGALPEVEDAEGVAEERDPDDFLEDLVARLMAGDEETIRRMAREAVARYGRAEGRDGGVNYFEYRVLRVVDPNRMLDRLLRERAAELGREPSPLEERLWRDEFEARLRQLRQEIEAEIRRRYADQHGPERVADRLVRAPLEERDLFRLTADEQRELHAQIRPLARKLAARVAVRRKHGRDGRLDVRRTVRRSLNTGGVPFDPVMRPRRPHKPELFVLCDVSGSVASFARFTLMLVHALQDQFSKVRSFAFVDTLDEVTGLFRSGDLDVSVSHMLREADLIWYDGHSDYGHSLEVFHRRYASDISARSTLLLLGDARNNHRRSNAWVLEDLSHRSRRLLWLNPEPRTMWGTGDSIAAHYARFCDEMVEVRSLKQLARFVERVA
jgi:uncharacterized protein